MSELIEIHWTCGSIDEARKVSRYLVQEHLVASAQIIPWFEAISMWNDQLETTQESKVVFKTFLTHYEEIQQFIKQNSSYQIPEIIYTKIENGDPDFLNWMKENTNKLQPV